MSQRSKTFPITIITKDNYQKSLSSERHIPEYVVAKSIEFINSSILKMLRMEKKNKLVVEKREALKMPKRTEITRYS